MLASRLYKWEKTSSGQAEPEWIECRPPLVLRLIIFSLLMVIFSLCTSWFFKSHVIGVFSGVIYSYFHRMNVIVAFDAFKDALSASDVCMAVAKGIRMACPSCDVTQLALADGGEGTAEVLTSFVNGDMVHVEVEDPLGRIITASYGLSPDGQTAFIDMAQASGLQLLQPGERNPLLTSTYGTGQLVRSALSKGVAKIILGIGGSATNDGGMGMASALGYTFLDRNGITIKGSGREMKEVDQVIPSAFLSDSSAEIIVLCDVNNPLLGPSGASAVYSPQKGAGAHQVDELEKGMVHFSRMVSSCLGGDHAEIPGAGAAGGMGFAGLAFLHARLESGIDTVLEISDFDVLVQSADLVITGEGRIDRQTLHGKVIAGVCARASAAHVPVVGLTGQLLLDPVEINELGMLSAFSISPGPGSLKDALRTTAEDLTNSAWSVMRLLTQMT
jgi:glycerate kinase